MNSKKESHIRVSAKADVAAVRHELFEGVDHLVVPIIALVEGVIQASNSPIAELARADVFGRFPLAWNGRPVTLDHPEVRGIKVSAAQTPNIFAEEALGFLFNTKVEDSKLKTEAWIDLEKVAAAGEHVQKEISRLESGDLVEVSTGLFTDIELNSGVFDGKEFEGIWKAIMPDHLAILPEGTTGACSVKDGCGGPRLNKENTDCTCGNSCDKCVSKIKTNSIRSTGVAKGTGAEHTHTFDDQEANGFTSEAEGHRHFMDIAGSKTEEMDGHIHDIPPKEFKQNNVKQFVGNICDKVAGVLKLNGDSVIPSDITETDLLLSALEAENKINTKDVIAVFDRNFVFTNRKDDTMFSREFTISDNKDVIFSGNTTQVNPVVDFIPVNMEEHSMTINAKIDELIANSANKLTEDDREWVSGLSEEQLAKLEPVEAEASVEEDLTDNNGHDTAKKSKKSKDANLMEKTSSDKKVAANAAPEAATVEDFIGTAPVEMQEVLQEGIRMHREQKAEFIKGLSETERCAFSKDDLKSMDLDHLKKLSRLADLPSYEGQVGNVSTNAERSEDLVPDAPLAFAPKSNKEG